jgi:1,4-alpha-glucan branching enzyme
MREDFINVLTRGQHDDPFAVLGPHCVTNESGPIVSVRAFLPMAVAVTLRPTTDQVLPQEMQRLHPEGVFETLFPGQASVFPYHLEIRHQNGECDD